MSISITDRKRKREKLKQRDHRKRAKEVSYVANLPFRFGDQLQLYKSVQKRETTFLQQHQLQLYKSVVNFSPEKFQQYPNRLKTFEHPQLAP